MNEMKMIEEKRELREAYRQALSAREASRLETSRLREENRMLRRELRAANRGNQRLSLAIKAGRALAESQAKVDKLESAQLDNGERIGIDLMDSGYRVVLTRAGGPKAYRGPDGVWSHGWTHGVILSPELEGQGKTNDEARRQSVLRGIPCVGDCDPPGILRPTAQHFAQAERNNAKGES